jgi:hypothetical protein
MMAASSCLRLAFGFDGICLRFLIFYYGRAHFHLWLLCLGVGVYHVRDRAGCCVVLFYSTVVLKISNGSLPTGISFRFDFSLALSAAHYMQVQVYAQLLWNFCSQHKSYLQPATPLFPSELSNFAALASFGSFGYVLTNTRSCFPGSCSC